jgi:hypothetical protein
MWRAVWRAKPTLGDNFDGFRVESLQAGQLVSAEVGLN